MYSSHNFFVACLLYARHSGHEGEIVEKCMILASVLSISDSPSVAPAIATSPLPGIALDMQLPESHPRPTESETGGRAQSLLAESHAHYSVRTTALHS